MPYLLVHWENVINDSILESEWLKHSMYPSKNIHMFKGHQAKGRKCLPEIFWHDQ